MAADFTILRALAQRAVDDGVTPGLVLGLAQAGLVRFLDAFGLRQVVPDVAGLTTDVVYDLASLTKAVVTSLLIMRGIGDGIWALDDPLDKHLPALAARPEVTLRRALAHAAGFAAHRPFFEQVINQGVAPADGRERVLALAAAEPLAYPPGTRSLYSDLGFMLLGDLVERGEARDGGAGGCVGERVWERIAAASEARMVPSTPKRSAWVTRSNPSIVRNASQTASFSKSERVRFSIRAGAGDPPVACTDRKYVSVARGFEKRHPDPSASGRNEDADAPTPR